MRIFKHESTLPTRVNAALDAWDFAAEQAIYFEEAHAVYRTPSGAYVVLKDAAVVPDTWLRLTTFTPESARKDLGR